MNKKSLWTLLGTAGGILALGIGVACVWNSHQMKLLRGTRRAEKILYKVGNALQNISGIMD